MSQKRLYREIRATMEVSGGGEATAEQMARINATLPEDAAPLEASDVYVRRAMVCNDMVDHYATKFTSRALEQISGMLAGPPLMRNHNRYGSEDLPVGRFFWGEQVRRRDATYVAGDFYWPARVRNAADMAEMIDTCVWREVSLAWYMRSFTNSIDGKPFDQSPYYPGQVLADGTMVVGIMDDIESVEEVSLVWKGGQKDTSIGAASAKGVDVLELVERAKKRGEKPGPFDAFFRRRPSRWDGFFTRKPAA